MKTPMHPKKSDEPVKYHCYDSCNKCGEVSDYTVTDSLDGRMMECKTKCKTCGFTDYWLAVKFLIIISIALDSIKETDISS